MSAHIDSVNGHAIHTQIGSVKNLIIEILSDDGTFDANDIDTISRMNLVVENLEQSLSAADANLLSLTWLNEANTALMTMQRPLTTFKANGQSNQLANAALQLDTILNTTTKTNLIKSRQTFKVSTKALENHVSDFNAIIEAYKEKLDKAKKAVEKIETLYDTQQQNTSAKHNEISETISDAKKQLFDLVNTHHAKMLEDQEKYSEAIQENNRRFTAALEGYKSEINSLKERVLAENETMRDNSSESMSRFEEESKALIEKTQSAFDSHEKEVAKMVGILSRDSFSYNYGQESDNARKSAKMWHIIAIASMIAVVGFAVFAFVFTLTRDVTWVNVVTKILVTGAGTSIAAYAAKQASKQDKMERYAKRTALELAAFDPFIRSLEQTKQDELKAEITKRIFGNIENIDTRNKEEKDSVLDSKISVEEVLKLLSRIGN